MKRSAPWSLVLLLLVGTTLAGCAPKDETLTAAPSPAPGAKPLAPVQRKFPRVKIPPLVGKDGKKAGGGDI